jgi:hypothetical protein
MPLDENQKKFIDVNQKKLSVRKLARHLGVDRSEVTKYLGKKPSPTLALPTKGIWPVIFLAVMILAVHLRSPAFEQPHDSGDQIFYTAVAMKLDAVGFKGYNLHDIGMTTDRSNRTLKLTHDKNTQETILKIHQLEGISFYNEPLFYAPPLLPYFIKLSHDIVANGKDYRLLDRNLWDKSKKLDFFKNPEIEFFALLVPFLSNLLIMVIVIIFCQRFLNSLTAFYAAILLSVSPINIMSASRIWADSTLTLFYTAALMLFYFASEKNHLGFAISGGVCAGS